MTTVEELIGKNDVEMVICELRDLLTLVISNQQKMENKYPETITYDHWTESQEDLYAMVERLSNYERLMKDMK